MERESSCSKIRQHGENGENEMGRRELILGSLGSSDEQASPFCSKYLLKSWQTQFSAAKTICKRIVTLKLVKKCV